ncbi:MAG: hypothetical protein ABIH23_01935 [bacterium]
MALRDADNFDFYSTVGDRWSQFTGVSISVGAGRRGTDALRVNGSNARAWRSYDNQATWIVHFSFRLVNPIASAGTLLKFYDGATEQCAVSFNASGKLTLQRQATVLATGTTTIQAGVEYHAQVKVTINNAGSMELKLNGVSEVSASGDTQATANAYANTIYFWSDGGTISGIYIDDYVLFDGTGAANNDFGGDLKVFHKLPSGTGNYAQWTPSAGANYENVDETPPDDDTTYNSSSTSGQKDSFQFSAASLTGSVPGVMCLYRARKDDAGSRTLRRLIRVGSSDYYGATLPGITDTYSYLEEILEQDPSTSATWTTSGVDAAEYGYDLVS